MKSRNMLLLLATLTLSLCGAQGAHSLITFMCSMFMYLCLYIPVQVLPEGIQSVNGSSTDMGCTSALVDSGDVMTCNSQSYLVDGVYH